jgi:hypothetical protein
VVPDTPGLLWVPDSPGLRFYGSTLVFSFFSGSRHTKIWPKYCIPQWGFEPRPPWAGRNMIVRPTPYQLRHCNCWTPNNFLLNINLIFEFKVIKSLP